MKPQAAIAELHKLIETEKLSNEETFIEWRSKAASVLRAVFGAPSAQLREFAASTEVVEDGYTVGTPKGDRERWRADAGRRGIAVLRAATFNLEVVAAERGPLDDTTIDPEFWSHVEGLIADSDWSKVPAEVVIFLEHKIRIWAGDPTAKDGAAMTGKNLFAAALRDDGQLRLGQQSSEHEGWRGLGTGLTQAIGNVARHRIQQRDDLRRYAMGVLGLGSLLLTQIRYEHPAEIQQAGTVEGVTDSMSTM